jgi:hypothetical protein
MNVLRWIPCALPAGFLVGFGLPLSADLLPLVAVSVPGAAYLLIAGGRIE